MKRFVRLLFVWRGYIREVAKSARRYPFRDVIFGLRHGFAADRVFLYGRQNILSGTYLNDIQRQSSRFINPKPVRELLEDKLLFGTLVAPIARVPVNYLYADHGSTVVVSAEWHDIASCRTGKVYRLVNKRARGGGGGGIRFLEISQGIVRFSGREMELSAFVKSFARRNKSLLCQFISNPASVVKFIPMPRIRCGSFACEKGVASPLSPKPSCDWARGAREALIISVVGGLQRS